MLSQEGLVELNLRRVSRKLFKSITKELTPPEEVTIRGSETQSVVSHSLQPH